MHPSRSLCKVLILALLTCVGCHSHNDHQNHVRDHNDVHHHNDVNRRSPQDLPFRNVSLPWDVRVEDLVGRLTVDEIMAQLSHGGRTPEAGPAPAIPRLGIKEYSWNTECLRGLGQVSPATSFPQALGLAASFNRSLAYAVAEATSKEARAKYSDYTKRNAKIGDHMGLSCFSPVVNIMRHALWGRNQETYGEDPYLSGQMGKSHVQGLLGDHPRYLRTNGGCKHFDVYGGPENIPVLRYVFDAQVTERDWRLTFLPAFYGCIVEGQSYSTMCSYNKINGVPACANPKLLTDILRHEWNFKGYVISDQDALINLVKVQNWKNTSEEAAASALLAGVNLELSTGDSRNVYAHLPAALRMNLIGFRDLLKAVRPLFYVRMRLGEFDPPEMNPYTKYSLDVIQSPEHREISIHAASQSFVLLKNNGVLPVEKQLREIAILGPMADDPSAINGDYSPRVDLKYYQTPRVGLSQLAGKARFANGCDNPTCENYDAQSIEATLDSPDIDLVVVCLGTGVGIESEFRDRSDMLLPRNQSQLLQDVIRFRNHKPIVLLLFTAGPLQIDPALLQAMDAIVDCFFPSQSAGDALQRLFLNTKPGGNPAGRLPFTWPVDLSQVPEMTSYSMSNRTYRYWDQSAPLYPFGYGMSYTTFRYSNLTLNNDKPTEKEDVVFEVDVDNTGKYDGDEVVQAYIQWLSPPEPMPRLQLIAFDRVHIPRGDKIRWKATIKANQMAVYLDKSGFTVVPGYLKLYVGGQQPYQYVTLSSNVLETTISIVRKPRVQVAERIGYSKCKP